MYDFIIIGSGVAGCTIFKELINKYPNKKILLLEKGNSPKYISEGNNNVQVLYVNSLGGSALYSVGNAFKIDLKYMGIGIKDDIYNEIENELNVNLVPPNFINESTQNLYNYGFKRTPKFINFNKCRSCGMCASKLCNAKWTPRNILLPKNSNSKIITNFEVLNIKKAEDVFFVEGIYKSNKNSDNNINSGNNNTNNSNSNNINNNINEKRIFKGKNVILSAGGINSPRILSSILDNEHIGKNLFVDTFITVGGVLKDANLNNSIPMSVYKKYGDDFILSPHYSVLLYNQIRENKAIKNRDIFSLMIKIKDENNGIVGKNYVYKDISKKDDELFSKGFKEALNIFSDMGIDKIYKTIPRGSHPSGTCAVGKVVNKDFETEIDGLFVCDASIFSKPIGLPPILGIIAIGKKLSHIL